MCIKHFKEINLKRIKKNRMKKRNLKIFLVAVPFIILAACSKTQEPDTAEVVNWDATNYVLYNEFMECVPGKDFSQEALDEMIAAWRDIGLSEDLLLE